MAQHWGVCFRGTFWPDLTCIFKFTPDLQADVSRLWKPAAFCLQLPEGWNSPSGSTEASRACRICSRDPQNCCSCSELVSWRRRLWLLENEHSPSHQFCIRAVTIGRQRKDPTCRRKHLKGAMLEHQAEGGNLPLSLAEMSERGTEWGRRTFPALNTATAACTDQTSMDTSTWPLHGRVMSCEISSISVPELALFQVEQNLPSDDTACSTTWHLQPQERFTRWACLGSNALEDRRLATWGSLGCGERVSRRSSLFCS